MMNALNQKLTACFTEILQAKPGWNRPTDEQFIQALAESVVTVGDVVKDGRGLAMLQTFVYDLQDLINADIFDRFNIEEDSSVKLTSKQRVVTPTPPSIVPVNLEKVFTWEDEPGLNQQSPLFKMGYTVAVDGPTTSKRRTILSQAFGEACLPGLVSEDEKNRWGAAHSAQRLYAMSKFLAWLCKFQGSDKHLARQYWVDDLGWLKKQYFRVSMRFSWPDVDVNKMPRKMRVPNTAFMSALTLSPELAAVVGASAMPRTEIVTQLWKYIKKNKLQDESNKRMINADAKLKKVFEKEQFTMFEMAGLIGKHVR